MFKSVLLVCGVIATVASVYVSDEKLIELRMRIEEIRNQLKLNGSETRDDVLREIIENIEEIDDFRKESPVNQGLMCGICYSAVTVFFNLRRIFKQSEEQLKETALRLCVQFNLQSKEVCSGLIEFNTPFLIYIVDNRTDLTPDTVCKVIFSEGFCSFPYRDEKIDFKVEIDKGEPPKRFTKNFLPRAMDELTVIHFTDIHFDSKYDIDSLADCDDYACCRKNNATQNITDTERLAKQWGDYRSCDTPWKAIIDAFDQIKRQHSKIDAIYFTGDVVDHFMWDVSLEGMKYEIEKVYNLIRESFSNIPIFPILGNHEAQNIFTPSDIEKESSLSVKWLYNSVAELWASFLPPDALSTVKEGGYYSTRFRPGLRLIALNNNVCYVFNWWIFHGSESIHKQFQWLHDELLDAEKAGEKVHILAHIPSGEDGYHEPCSREFRKIVDRFSDTISAQFNGHTETFGFNVFYNENKELPVNIAWNGGSLATFSNVNRNYILYNLDPNDFHIRDIKTWIYNLTAANQDDSQNPIWFQQFSFRDAFDLSDLSPTTMSDFIQSLPNNSSTIQQLWKMKIRDSDLLLKGGCNRRCMTEVVCETLITDNNDKKKCEAIKRRIRIRRT